MNKVHSSPRQRRRELRIEEILEAAEQLLEEGGPDHLTIARLAEALDYTVGAVYRYFPSKGAILAEVELRQVAEVTEVLEAALDRAAAALEGSRLNQRRRSLVPILLLAETYALLPFQHPRAFAALSLGLARDGRLTSAGDDQQVMERVQPFLTRVAELFGRARETGVLTPGSDADRAIRLWALLHGATSLRRLEPTDSRFAPGPDLALELTDDWLHACGAPRRALEAARRFLDRMGDPT
ncbi:MAG: helix-turn-helix domain containing protein [Deltaproteobacteria bacterium]|nr:helix-turn-helix domain containing protein [Deltaproteobacteria bacterium]